MLNKEAIIWISHTDKIPPNTRAIINAAGYTGKPNVDAYSIYFKIMFTL
jgi:hypothetical protein